MKNTQLTARSLRIALGLSLVLLMGVIGGGFYFIQAKLRVYAVETSKLNTEASSSQQKIVSLQNLRKSLDNLQPEQELAKRIVAESKQYQYQNEIINDISEIAAASGVTITSYVFSDTASAAGSGAAATPAPAPNTATPPATAASGAPGAATPTPAATAQLNSKTVTVAFKSPLNYVDFLNFVHRIEQNPTKMQIANINSLSRGDSSDSVTTESFQIEVYVR